MSENGPPPGRGPAASGADTETMYTLVDATPSLAAISPRSALTAAADVAADTMAAPDNGDAYAEAITNCTVVPAPPGGTTVPPPLLGERPAPAPAATTATTSTTHAIMRARGDSAQHGVAAGLSAPKDSAPMDADLENTVGAGTGTDDVSLSGLEAERTTSAAGSSSSKVWSL